MRIKSIIICALLSYSSTANADQKSTLNSVFNNSFNHVKLNLNNKVIAFSIAKECNKIAVLTSNKNSKYLQIYDLSGKRISSFKISDSKSEYYEMETSNNLETILVSETLGEFYRNNIFYNENGNILREEKSNKIFRISGDGNYFDYFISGDRSSGHAFEIYTRSGQLLNQTINPYLSEGSFELKLIGKDKVLAFNRSDKNKAQKLIMVQLPNLTVEWEYSFQSPVWILTLETMAVDQKGNSIAFIGRGYDKIKSPTQILSFNGEGHLKWKKTDIYYADKVIISNDEKYLYVYQGTSGSYLYILDNNNGKIISMIKLNTILTHMFESQIVENKLIISGDTFTGYATQYYNVENIQKPIFEGIDNCLKMIMYNSNRIDIIEFFKSSIEDQINIYSKKIY